MVSLGNPEHAVVVFVAVLGSKIAESTWITLGTRASRLAKVSSIDVNAHMDSLTNCLIKNGTGAVPPAVTTRTPAASPKCRKCGRILKTGKFSCCARGGSWFKKCGDDDGRFDHTWSEGVQACNTLESLVLDKERTNTVFSEENITAQQSKDTLQPNLAQDLNTDSAVAIYRDSMSCIAVSTIVLFFIMSMWV